MNKNWKIIANRIQGGIDEYEKDIVNMNDKDLYEHVYDDYDPNDFASKELAKRGIGKCECNGAKQIIGCPAKLCCYWETNGT